MNPQPEESPDEILARRIDQKRAAIAAIKDRPSDYEYGALNRAQKDLAMLEALLGHRDVAKMNTKGHSERPLVAKLIGDKSCICEDCKALRQSDDAIRGMRG